MLTAEQTIKIDNWKAQHNSLLVNIKDTNKKLEDLLGNIKVAERELKGVDKELFVKRKELVEILESIVEADNQTSKKIEQLEQQEKETKKATNDLNKTEKRLNGVAKIHQKEFHKITKKIGSLETTFVLVHLTIESKQRKLQEINKVIQTKTNEKRELDSSLSELNHNIEDNKVLFDKENTIHKQRLEEVKKKVDKEIEKLKLPNQLIDDRERDLKKKENNFLILTLRWKKLFKKMFPNQEFKY